MSKYVIGNRRKSAIHRLILLAVSLIIIIIGGIFLARHSYNEGLKPVSGSEFFGLTDPTLCRLIQELPNASRCTRYKMVDFAAKVTSSLLAFGL